MVGHFSDPSLFKNGFWTASLLAIFLRQLAQGGGGILSVYFFSTLAKGA